MVHLKLHNLLRQETTNMSGSAANVSCRGSSVTESEWKRSGCDRLHRPLLSTTPTTRHHPYRRSSNWTTLLGKLYRYVYSYLRLMCIYTGVSLDLTDVVGKGRLQQAQLEYILLHDPTDQFARAPLAQREDPVRGRTAKGQGDHERAHAGDSLAM